MDIISNTLKPVIETWSDPGEYPSGAGGGPLASRRYVARFDGEIVVKLNDADVKFLAEEDTTDLEYITEGDFPHGISGLHGAEWQITSNDGIRVTLELTGFESVDTPDEDEPDYDGGDDA